MFVLLRITEACISVLCPIVACCFVKQLLQAQLCFTVKYECTVLRPSTWGWDLGWLGQGWEFNLSISDLSIFWIFKRDWPWSNRSCRSFKKIYYERIAQFDLWKRSKRSNRARRSLKKFKKVEWLSKTSDSLKMYFSCVFDSFQSFNTKNR